MKEPGDNSRHDACLGKKRVHFTHHPQPNQKEPGTTQLQKEPGARRNEQKRTGCNVKIWLTISWTRMTQITVRATQTTPTVRGRAEVKVTEKHLLIHVIIVSLCLSVSLFVGDGLSVSASPSITLSLFPCLSLSVCLSPSLSLGLCSGSERDCRLV